MNVKKGAKKPIKARRTWTINPKTRVAESGQAYKRQRAKIEAKKLYEVSTKDTKT